MLLLSVSAGPFNRLNPLICFLNTYIIDPIIAKNPINAAIDPIVLVIYANTEEYNVETKAPIIILLQLH